jgi:hypothetical protein
MIEGINFYEKNAIKEFFFKRPYFQKNSTKRPNKEEIASSIKEILELLELPNFISHYSNEIYNEYILEYLVMFLWNFKSTTMLRKHLIENDISPFQYIDKAVYTKARLGAIEGDYPNIDIKIGETQYVHRNGIPVLISNTKKYNTEISFINRAELKFASSLLITPGHPRCNFYFDKHNLIKINKLGLKELPNNETVNFLFDLIFLQSTRMSSSGYFVKKGISTEPYRFYPFEDKLDLYNDIFSRINIEDNLLMRTLFYLVKSRMLWANRCFGEDAISNVLFSIEGALLLLQRKNKINEKQINLLFLSEFFKTNFPHGEDLFEFIREGYDKRVAIVHPNPRSGAEWTPYLEADDFYEYFDVSKLILHYVITDKLIELE